MGNILQGKGEYFTLIQKYSHYQQGNRMIEYNQIKGKGGERAVSEYVLELKGITKIFPGVKALNNVQFQLKPGEVHALMGENGAGKSTFIKVITGVHKAEEGEMFLNGQKVDFKGAEGCPGSRYRSRISASDIISAPYSCRKYFYGS